MCEWTLCFHLVSGIGLGMTALASIVIVQQYFTRRRPLAAGLALCGMACGLMTGGPVTQLLIDRYGWRGTLIILAGLTLHILVLAMMFRPLMLQKRKRQTTMEMTVEGDNAKFATKNDTDSMVTKQSACKQLCSTFAERICDFSVFGNPGFVMCLAGTFCMTQGLTSFLSHSPSRAVFLGVDKQRSSLLLTSLGLSGLVARFITSFVANMKQNGHNNYFYPNQTKQKKTTFTEITRR